MDVDALDVRPGHRQARVRIEDGSRLRSDGRLGLGLSDLGCGGAQVGVVGQFLGPASGAAGEVPVGVGLQPPGDALDQVLPVAGARRFPEGIDVFGSQLRDRHAAQGGDLFGDVQRHGLRAPFMFRLFSGVPAERLVTRSYEGSFAAPHQGLPGRFRRFSGGALGTRTRRVLGTLTQA